MGNKRGRKPRLSLKLMRKQQGIQRQKQIVASGERLRGVHKVPSLAVLCGRVIKKFKLLPKPKKKFTPPAPESVSIIGGKPLRKRSQKPPPEDIKGEKRKNKSRSPPSLAALCQIVVKKYRLLPECEETIRPSAGTSSVKKKTSGKRKITGKEIKTDNPAKRRKEKPRKKDDTTKTVTYVNYATFLRESQITRNVKIEEEFNPPREVDPLQDDDDYTIVVKEEHNDEEDTLSTQETPLIPVPQATSKRKTITINPSASVGIPGPSGRGLTPAAHYMTVIADQYQIFANSVAEQLRALPPQRALLLQLDIQSMIDNEKELLMHEN